MNAVKLMPDYGCFPLWDASPDGLGNVDPDRLPISQSLKDRLAAWADRYDATLDPADPMASGFAGPDAQRAFEEEGHALAGTLRQELGSGFTVTTQI